MNTNSSSPVVPINVTPISGRLDGLEVACQELMKRIDELGQKLTPCLLPDLTEPESVCMPPQGSQRMPSPIGAQVEQLREVVRFAIRRVSAITDRLEV